MADSFHHRSSLKQTNKKYKGSASSTKRKQGGRIEKGDGKRVAITHVDIGHVSKTDRMNHAKQLKQKKREALLAKKRMGGDAAHGPPPKIVMLVAFNETANIVDFRNELVRQCLGGDLVPIAKLSSPDPITMVIPPSAGGGATGSRKQRLTFILAPRDMYGLLDCAKVADVVVAVADAANQSRFFDDLGYSMLSGLRTQGMPEVLGVIQNLRTLSGKHKNDQKRLFVRYFESEFSDSYKVLTMDTAEEVKNILRAVAVVTPKDLNFRENRSYMLTQNVEYNPETAVLKLSGYLRGEALSANQLVHLTGHGDFQLEQIDLTPDPVPLSLSTFLKRRAMSSASDMSMDSMASANASDMLSEPKTLETANPQYQESLVAENTPDPFASEQALPDEAMEADATESKKKKKFKIPKGWSEYQAAWIVDEEREEADSDDEQEAEADMDVGQSGGQEQNEEEDESEGYEEEDESDLNSNMNDGIPVQSMEEMAAERQRIKQEMIERSKEDMELPDEVDTPMDKPASQRFARYRGLKSFRTSAWDVKENLPQEFSRIFQFQNFSRTYKRILSDSIGFGVATAGCYVTLYVKNVSPQLLVDHPSHIPLIVSSLLPHEHKVSVVNFTVEKFRDYPDVIKSKEPCEFHVGFRRFVCEPIFSEHGLNSDKYKMERFLQPGRISVASIYGPITFPSAPLLVFRPTFEAPGVMKLAATGSLLSVDPDRIVVKKIVLTGYPFRVHRKKAVVRYMFWNPKDIMYFKPIELTTKHGLRGHIREPLGTHGYMKCQFNAPVKHHDTVCMNLFKRVFPKWNPAAWGCKYYAVPPVNQSM